MQCSSPDCHTQLTEVHSRKLLTSSSYWLFIIALPPKTHGCFLLTVCWYAWIWNSSKLPVAIPPPYVRLGDQTPMVGAFFQRVCQSRLSFFKGLVAHFTDTKAALAGVFHHFCILEKHQQFSLPAFTFAIRLFQAFSLGPKFCSSELPVSKISTHLAYISRLQHQ